jgi:hypothetical protein
VGGVDGVATVGGFAGLAASCACALTVTTNAAIVSVTNFTGLADVKFGEAPPKSEYISHLSRVAQFRVACLTDAVAVPRKLIS